MVANNTTVPVMCAGNVDIKTVANGMEHDVVIKNVLYVPQLTTNLLSVSQLIKMGNMVKFSEKGCDIYNKEQKLVGTADLVENVYRLNIYKVEKCLLTSSQVPSMDTWHRRLGHINSNDLRKIRKWCSARHYVEREDRTQQRCV